MSIDAKVGVLGKLIDAVIPTKAKIATTAKADSAGAQTATTSEAAQITVKPQILAAAAPPKMPSPQPSPRPNDGMATSSPAIRFDKDAAAKYADDNAEPQSIGQCGQYTRESIESGLGGVKLDHHDSAKDYGPSLEKVGFQKVQTSEKDYKPQKGDVVIFQGFEGHEDGHMQIYDGKQFVSDFPQKDKLWPNNSPTSPWQQVKPSFDVYRHSN